MLFTWILLAPALADVLYQGTMHVVPLSRRSVPQLIGVDQHGIVADHSISYFSYHESGALSFGGEGLYVGVAQNGKLVMGAKPDTAFRLSDRKENIWWKSLSYEGDAEFQLCGDNRVGYKSNCEGARPILIAFERDWPIPGYEMQ